MIPTLGPRVREQALTLASRDRLFIQDAGHSNLRPATGPDVLDVFGEGRGTLFVATRRHTTVNRQQDQSLSVQGFHGWAQSLHRVTSDTTSAVVQYSAVPILDVDEFCSIPMRDGRGRPLEGVPVESLSPGLGTVEIASSFLRDKVDMTQNHFWSGDSSAHYFTKATRTESETHGDI